MGRFISIRLTISLLNDTARMEILSPVISA
jgi:hypothetical protein